MTLPPGLQAVRERADKATAGPWAAEKRETSCGYAWHIDPIGACLYVDTRGGVCNPDMDDATAKANAELLADSRTDVPALLDLIETLAGAAEHLRNTDGHEGVDWDASENFKAQQELDAALDKYKEFK